MTDWCYQCERNALDDDGCYILLRAENFLLEEPEYPSEWRFDDCGIPYCAAFVLAGTPIPPPPDTLSGNLFEEVKP
jgi:hypothetical protein